MILKYRDLNVLKDGAFLQNCIHLPQCNVTLVKFGLCDIVHYTHVVRVNDSMRSLLKSFESCHTVSSCLSKHCSNEKGQGVSFKSFMLTSVT